MAYPRSNFEKTYWRIYDGDIYVSSIVPSGSGKGTPDDPVSSINDAIKLLKEGNKIVVGTGNYNECVDGNTIEKYSIVADGIVIMNGKREKDNLPYAFRNMGINCNISGFQLLNYQNVALGSCSFYDCKIYKSNFSEFQGSLLNCLLFSGFFAPAKDVKLINCTIQEYKVSQGVATIENCHISSDTELNIDSHTTFYFDFCNQEPGSSVYIDSQFCPDVKTVNELNQNYQKNGINVPPVFNNVLMYDYTLNEESPLLFAGNDGKYIGAYNKGYSLHNQVNCMNSNLLQNEVLKDVFVDPSNGNYRLIDPINSKVYYFGTMESEVIDLGCVVELGKTLLFASEVFERPPKNAVIDNDNSFTHPNIITYQIRYSLNDSDLKNIPYETMAWNTQPSIDPNGNPNGALKYNPEKYLRTIYTRYIQLLITFQNPGNLPKVPILNGLTFLTPDYNCSLQVQDLSGNYVTNAKINITSEKDIHTGITDLLGYFYANLKSDLLYGLVISKKFYFDYNSRIKLLSEKELLDLGNNLVIQVLNAADNNPVSDASVSIINTDNTSNGHTNVNGIYEGYIDSRFTNELLIESDGFNSLNYIYKPSSILKSLKTGYRIVPVIMLEPIL